jgi:tRNA (guanosine-2'-O-)-methyltransferase
MKDMAKDRVLKATSKSGIKWMPIKKFINIQDCITYLDANDFESYATSSLDVASTVDLVSKHCCGMFTHTKTKNIAIWFGNEVSGLSKEAINYCKTCIKIPSLGIVECLNVSCCAAIVLFHVTTMRTHFLPPYVT